MKIGILTFHRAINYGAVLQCYALYDTLRCRGHNVEVIDFRPPYIEKYREVFNLNSSRSIIGKTRNIVKGFILGSKKREAIRNFDDFLSLLKFSTVVKTAHDISVLNYDIIVSGSDQVFNKRITGGKFEDLYWGHFEHPNSKFISYAASYGELVSFPQMDDVLKEMFSKMDAVSVREQKFASYLCGIGINAHVCVDPTILAKRQLFVELAETPPIDEPYILVYALKDREKVISWSRKIQDKTNLKIVVLGGNVSIKTRYNGNVFLVQGVSPKVFLGYFKNATYIVNASFHGTVFSTLFHKNFYSLSVGNSGRYRQYLEAVGLPERFLSFEDDPFWEPLDYSLFEIKKAQLIKNSEDYLLNVGI